jgi:hypothetical protein
VARRDHRGPVALPACAAGLGIYGAAVSPHALVEATADGHPRAVAAVSWEPATTVNAIRAHPFYRDLVAADQRRAAAGCVFLPLALETAVLLRRNPSIRRG